MAKTVFKDPDDGGGGTHEASSWSNYTTSEPILDIETFRERYYQGRVDLPSNHAWGTLEGANLGDTPPGSDNVEYEQTDPASWPLERLFEALGRLSSPSEVNTSVLKAWKTGFRDFMMGRQLINAAHPAYFQGRRIGEVLVERLSESAFLYEDSGHVIEKD